MFAFWRQASPTRGVRRRRDISCAPFLWRKSGKFIFFAKTHQAHGENQLASLLATCLNIVKRNSGRACAFKSSRFGWRSEGCIFPAERNKKPGVKPRALFGVAVLRQTMGADLKMISLACFGMQKKTFSTPRAHFHRRIMTSAMGERARIRVV